MKIFAVLAVTTLLAGGLGATTITNGSFETPALGASSFVYNPSGATWGFFGTSGISSNGSAFGFLAAPGGTQEAFLQSFGGTNIISETVSAVAPGDVITFSYAARPGYGAETFTVSYNGVNIGTFTPSSTAWTAGSVTIQAGAPASGVLAFTGLSNSAVDLNVGIDIVASTTTSATPEPVSMLLFGSGLLAVSLTGRKKFVSSQFLLTSGKSLVSAPASGLARFPRGGSL